MEEETRDQEQKTNRKARIKLNSRKRSQQNRKPSKDTTVIKSRQKLRRLLMMSL